MNRRRFLLTSLAGALAAPLAATAQQGKVWKLGFLSYLGCATSLPPDGDFRQGLRALGYVESRNIVIECREEVPGAVDRFPDLASQLVRLKVDILVAESTPASLAAKAATTTIPIVMIGVADPVTSGLVTTLARPGGNVTGLSLYAPLDFGGKTLELLKEIVPHLTRVAVLRDPINPAQLDIRQIIDFAIENTLPLATFFDRYADQGVLLSYAPSLLEQYRRAGIFVDKILKGAKPADIPVEQPTKFELVINLKTAKALGLTIPPSLLARADRVIE